MAHRKRSTKKTSHHRRGKRRVSGVGKTHTNELVMMAAGLVLGGAAGRMLATSIGANFNPKLVSVGQILAGALIVNNTNTPLLHGVGYGMIAVGGTDLAQRVGIIRGIGEDIEVITGVGADDMPVLAGVAGIGEAGMDLPLPPQTYAVSGIGANYGGGYLTHVLSGEA